MTFYIFQCSTDNSLYGATDDPIGAKLPRLSCQNGRWIHRAGLNESAIGFNAAEAEQGITAQGFHLFHAKVGMRAPWG